MIIWQQLSYCRPDIWLFVIDERLIHGIAWFT